MNDSAIKKFLDHPQNGWERRLIGAFVLYVWPWVEPPRWTSSTIALQTGSSRAFLGRLPTKGHQEVDKALKGVEDFLNACGFKQPKAPPCRMVFWDMAFPKPEEWDLPEVPSCPVAFPPDSDDEPGLILLPAYGPGKSGGAEFDRLASAAVHEGFHALLCRWLGRDRMVELRGHSTWRKFEEMCAVMLEHQILPQSQAFFDYGRSWQSSLSLSHCDNDWGSLLFLNGSSLGHSLNREDYGHFPLLSFLESVVWPSRKRPDHWLKKVWEAGKQRGASIDPWDVLQVELKDDGGVADLFRRYVHEVAFPAKSTIVIQYHKIIGPSAASSMVHPGPRKVFEIGPLGAQLLLCHGGGKNTGGLVRLIDHRGLEHTEVRAFSVTPKPNYKCVNNVPVHRPPQQGKTKVWEINLSDCQKAPVLVMVMQPNHAGRSVPLSVEWK